MASTDNRQLLADFYSVHRGELLAYAGSRLGGNASVAQDLVQDVFVRLLSTNKLITPVTLPALVYTTLRHLVVDRQRQWLCHRQVEQQIATAVAFEHQVSIEPAVFADELLTHVEHCLHRLPEECATVYRMNLYDGMKVGEIAKSLGQSYKHVEHRLGIARKLVRQRLAAG